MMDRWPGNKSAFISFNHTMQGGKDTPFPEKKTKGKEGRYTPSASAPEFFSTTQRLNPKEHDARGAEQNPSNEKQTRKGTPPAAPSLSLFFS
jgi:hypothetical protein